jgi:hypothetical protein
MDPEINAVIDQHKNICLEMGYDLKDVDEAVKDLRNMGMWMSRATVINLLVLVSLSNQSALAEKNHQNG